MHEITIISGKGGTGKTSITAAFASIAKNYIVCDLDVDASNLHLLLSPKPEKTELFISGNEAKIDLTMCDSCGLCEEFCKFDAVKYYKDLKGFAVDPIRCEGCGVCVALCPKEAISFPHKTCGEWYQSTTRFAPMIHAKLFAGEENSGLLVSLLRKKARELAVQNNNDIILCDGSPGIGCPVIASITGTDLAIIVTEPTPSGFHDMKRALELCRDFNVETNVIINKYDLNLKNTKNIKKYCKEQNIKIIAEIPHSEIFVQAMINKQTILEYSNDTITDIIKTTWERIIQ